MWARTLLFPCQKSNHTFNNAGIYFLVIQPMMSDSHISTLLWWNIQPMIAFSNISMHKLRLCNINTSSLITYNMRTTETQKGQQHKTLSLQRENWHFCHSRPSTADSALLSPLCSTAESTATDNSGSQQSAAQLSLLRGVCDILTNLHSMQTRVCTGAITKNLRN